jgi:hypothetical protein
VLPLIASLHRYWQSENKGADLGKPDELLSPLVPIVSETFRDQSLLLPLPLL